MTYQVPVTTVDAITARFALTALDLVKIDVEGNELAVLKGARTTLERFRPALIVEISRHQRAVGYSGAEIRAFLAGLGYECFRLHPGGRSPYQPDENEINPEVSHFNVLALPRAS